jgi:hypothetical protein
MLCGPGAVTEDTARNGSVDEQRGEGRTEGLAGQGMFVLCETTKGIVTGWGIKKGFKGRSHDFPKAILRGRKAGASLVGVMVSERMGMMGWVDEKVGELVMGVKKVHPWTSGRLSRWVADVVGGKGGL